MPGSMPARVRIVCVGRASARALVLEALQLVVFVAEQVLVSHGQLPSRPVDRAVLVHRDATGPGTLGGSVEKS